MEVDSSGRHIQRTQFQPNNSQIKRQRDPSFQHMNRQQHDPSFQHVNKQQRVNHVDEPDDIQSVNDNSLENNYESDVPDFQSTTSEQRSIFLEE